METELVDSEVKVSSLQSDLKKSKDDIEAKQTINSALSEELKTVKDPRYFESLTELVDWLHEDDTDTRYADESSTQKACILQVRALRDGYLLFAFAFEEGYGYNWAVIGDELWGINPEDDEAEFIFYVDPLPSHPLPME